MMFSKKRIGFGFIIFGAVLLLLYQIFQPQIIQILEIYISADGQITPSGVRQLNSIFYISVALLMILGFGLFKAEDEEWQSRLKQVFLGDPFCPAPKTWLSPKIILLASTLIGLFLIIHIRLYDPESQLFAFLYLEDGVFESLTPILMVVSIVLLALSIPLLRKDTQLSKYRNLLTLVYLFLILIFFLNAMEEISWGQRVFGWETPQTFEGNIQDETNLHNYFNQYYLLFYRLLVLFPIVIFISIWLEMSQRFVLFNQTVLPHPSMIGFSLLIALVSFVWYQEQELLEELFAVFFLFYSLRIYNCFRIRGKAAKADAGKTGFESV